MGHKHSDEFRCEAVRIALTSGLTGSPALVRSRTAFSNGRICKSSSACRKLTKASSRRCSSAMVRPMIAVMNGFREHAHFSDGLAVPPEYPPSRWPLRCRR
jgi:hypothetical protein